MERAPVDGCNFLVIPCDFFAQCAAHALQCSALGLIAKPVGIRNGTRIDRHPYVPHQDFARILIQIRLYDNARISVIAFVGHHRYAASGHYTRARVARFRRSPCFPIGKLRGSLENIDDALVTQMPKRYSTGSAFIFAATSSMKHSCANVFWKREGERSGPVKKGEAPLCVSERSDLIVPVPAVSFDAARQIRRHPFELLLYCVGSGAGEPVQTVPVRSRAGIPLTTLPGKSSQGRFPFAGDQFS